MMIRKGLSKYVIKYGESYRSCVVDLLAHPLVRSMDQYIQHHDVTTFDHSLVVSFYSYLACKKLRLDGRSAARGALLHDFYLYDWHIPGSRTGLHGFTHAMTAFNNARTHFRVNPLEADIIRKHMWPLNLGLPRYKETVVVILVDKLVATLETVHLINGNYMGKVNQYMLGKK